MDTKSVSFLFGAQLRAAGSCTGDGGLLAQLVDGDTDPQPHAQAPHEQKRSYQDAYHLGPREVPPDRNEWNDHDRNSGHYCQGCECQNQSVSGHFQSLHDVPIFRALSRAVLQRSHVLTAYNFNYSIKIINKQ